MGKDKLFPDYIFESSWEVCNKVGGIYTVLSTRAKTLTEKLQDRLIFIGPDCWGDKVNPYFSEDTTLYAEWKTEAQKEGLIIKIGRWNIPGEPVAILVDFTPYYAIKDQIYGQLWNDYQVDSLHAYGDYDEASMFSYAAALGTKLLSNPLGNTKSTGLSSNSLHSVAVISLTVVKQSTNIAVCFSIECLLCIFSSPAIWSPL